MAQVPIRRCPLCGQEPTTDEGRIPPGVRVLLVQEPGEGTYAVFHRADCEMVPAESLLTPGPTAQVWTGTADEDGEGG